MYDIIVKIYWGVYFVQKADLDPLIFVPARDVPRHILFYYLVLRKSYEKERGYPL